MSDKTILQLMQSDYTEDRAKLCPAIDAIDDKQEPDYIKEQLPVLQEWAEGLAEPPVWYVTDLSQLERAQRLAPFAITGFRLTAQNHTQLATPEAAPIRAVFAENLHAITPVEIIDALSSPHLQLTQLMLSDRRIDASMMEAITHAPTAPTLTHLRFEGVNNKPIKGVEKIAKSPHMSSLTHLDLSRGAIGLRAAKAIFTSPHMSSLTHLALSFCKLNAKSIEILAGSPHMSSLTHLSIKSNKLEDEGLVPLAYSPHMKNLVSLHIGDCKLGMPSLQALFDSPSITGLKSLELYSTRFNGLARALAQSHNMRALEHLDIMWAGGASSDFKDALINAENLTNLRYLHTSDAQEIINASPHLTQCQAVPTWHFGRLVPVLAPPEHRRMSRLRTSPRGGANLLANYVR